MKTDKEKKSNKKKFMILFISLFLVISAVTVSIILLNTKDDENNYEEVQEGEDSTQSEFVKFDAYFLESTDTGIAKKVRGVCAKTTDIKELYMNFEVLNEGYLKDGKISIDTSTSNLQIVGGVITDNEIKEVKNLAGEKTASVDGEEVPTNIEIILNDIQNGTAKNIQALIKSKIYNNINDTSKISKIIFTGTYVDYEGNEIKIEKEVNLKTDFYNKPVSNFLVNVTRIKSAIAIEEADSVMIEMNLYTVVNRVGLIPSEDIIYGTLPKFNGYDPVNVSIVDDKVIKDDNIKLEYNYETREINISKKAEIDENGDVIKSIGNLNNDWGTAIDIDILVEYPYEAYEKLGGTDIAINFPFKAYSKAYNNKNIGEEIAKSDEVETILTLKASGIGSSGVTFSIDMFSAPSKKNQSYMYLNNEEVKTEYSTYWDIHFDYSENVDNFMIKEDYSTSKNSENSQFKGDKDYFLSTDGNFYNMDDFVDYTGIQLTDTISNDYSMSNPAPNLSTDPKEYYTFWSDYNTVIDYKNRFLSMWASHFSILGDDGWVKVYNDETNELVVTLNKENNWGVSCELSYTEYDDTFKQEIYDKYGIKVNGKYSLEKITRIYTYEEPIKHIRVETSAPVYNSATIYIRNMKTIDNAKMKEIYNEEKFNSFNYVYTSAHGYVKYKSKDEYFSARGMLSYANYLMKKVYLSSSALTNLNSTEVVQKDINITLNSIDFEDWKNGVLLLEFPEEITDININNFSIQIENSSYQILDEKDFRIKKCETIEQNGKNYLKIYLDGYLKNRRAKLTINTTLTLNPFSKTSTKSYKVYAYDEIASGYVNYVNVNTLTADIYDINENGDTTENIGLYTGNITINAPTGLITATQGSNFNTRNDVILSPQVGTVFKHDTGRTAQVDVIMQNSYNNSIQDVLLLGVFPYEGNKSPITNTDLRSTYTAIVNGAITVPDNLKDTVTVYYSTKENVTKDLNDTSNEWVTSENVTDWSKVRSYLIDFGSTVMNVGDKYTFSYNISFPDELDYDEVVYATHGIYFNLNTDTGLLEMKTEPSKVGFRVGPKYTFEVDTSIYEVGTENVIPNAKVLVKGPGLGEGKEYITDENGYIYIQGLYADEEYTIEQVEVPERYILNNEVIKFKVNSPINEENNDPFTLELIQNSFRNNSVITQDSFGNTTIHTELENKTQPGKIVVKYVDKEGNEIADTETFSGIVGEEYITNRKSIKNYIAYGEEPQNKNGKYTVEEQIITYVYDKIDAKVIIKYVDVYGYEISPSDMKDGKAGEKYITERKIIEGYRANGDDPVNKSGIMEEEPIEVVYVYEKIPASVIIKYVDEKGKELLPQERIDGKVGDEYITDRKEIEGYVASGNDPENKSGKMLEGEIEVVYIYKKGSNEVDTGDINVVGYVVISIVAVCGIFGIIYYLKKHNKKLKNK